MIFRRRKRKCVWDFGETMKNVKMLKILWHCNVNDVVDWLIVAVLSAAARLIHALTISKVCIHCVPMSVAFCVCVVFPCLSLSHILPHFSLVSLSRSHNNSLQLHFLTDFLECVCCDGGIICRYLQSFAHCTATALINHTLKDTHTHTQRQWAPVRYYFTGIFGKTSSDLFSAQFSLCHNDSAHTHTYIQFATCTSRHSWKNYVIIVK